MKTVVEPMQTAEQLLDQLQQHLKEINAKTDIPTKSMALLSEGALKWATTRLLDYQHYKIYCAQKLQWAKEQRTALKIELENANEIKVALEKGNYDRSIIGHTVQKVSAECEYFGYSRELLLEFPQKRPADITTDTLNIIDENLKELGIEIQYEGAAVKAYTFGELNRFIEDVLLYYRSNEGLLREEKHKHFHARITVLSQQLTELTDFYSQMFYIDIGLRGSVPVLLSAARNLVLLYEKQPELLDRTKHKKLLAEANNQIKRMQNLLREDFPAFCKSFSVSKKSTTENKEDSPVSPELLPKQRQMSLRKRAIFYGSVRDSLRSNTVKDKRGPIPDFYENTGSVVIKEEAAPVENDSSSEVSEESTGSVFVNSTGTVVIKKEVSPVEDDSSPKVSEKDASLKPVVINPSKPEKKKETSVGKENLHVAAVKPSPVTDTKANKPEATKIEKPVRMLRPQKYVKQEAVPVPQFSPVDIMLWKELRASLLAKQEQLDKKRQPKAVDAVQTLIKNMNMEVESLLAGKSTPETFKIQSLEHLKAAHKALDEYPGFKGALIKIANWIKAVVGFCLGFTGYTPQFFDAPKPCEEVNAVENNLDNIARLPVV